MSLDLPQHLGDIFRRLNAGYHICAEDGEQFHELEERHQEYHQIFTALGYRLSDGVGGFYYLEGDASSTKPTERVAVFIYVYIEALADAGDDPLSVFESIRYIPMSELPHLGDKYRPLMQQVDVGEPEGLKRTIQSLGSYGFVEIGSDGESFRFKRPIMRFVDACREVASNHKEQSE
jgi:hypothetical protein